MLALEEMLCLRYHSSSPNLPLGGQELPWGPLCGTGTERLGGCKTPEPSSALFGVPRPRKGERGNAGGRTSHREGLSDPESSQGPGAASGAPARLTLTDPPSAGGRGLIDTLPGTPWPPEARAPRRRPPSAPLSGPRHGGQAQGRAAAPRQGRPRCEWWAWGAGAPRRGPQRLPTVLVAGPSPERDAERRGHPAALGRGRAVPWGSGRSPAPVPRAQPAPPPASSEPARPGLRGSCRRTGVRSVP